MCKDNEQHLTFNSAQLAHFPALMLLTLLFVTNMIMTGTGLMFLGVNTMPAPIQLIKIIL